MKGARKGLAIAAVLGGLYAIASGLGAAVARPLVYPAPRQVEEPRLDGATLERIAGADGRTVYALYAPAPAGAPTLVHFHGNGEQLADVAPLAAALRRRGLGVLAVEYPGYGLAGAAKAGEQHIYADAETAIVHLETSGVPRASIVLEGQSLGTGVAVEMARRGHGAKLILISPYTSIVDVARRVVPFLPVRWLMSEHFDTASKAPRVALPALVIHGASDEVIPVDMGRRVASLLPHAQLVIVPGGHHNDLFSTDGAHLVRRIAAFALAR